MSAPDNPAHDPNMNTEAVAATSLETSSTKESSGQELTLDFEGLPTGIRGQIRSSMDQFNDRSDVTDEVPNDTSDQVPGSPLISPASSVELSEQDSGPNQAATGTDQEQSDPVNMSTTSDHVTQPLNQEPVSPRSPEHGRQAETVHMHSIVVERETQSRTTDEAAKLSASVNVPLHMRPDFVAPGLHYSEPVQSRVSRNRTTRGNGLPQGQRSNNSQHEFAEIMRLNSQIFKIQDDLYAERTKNFTQRQQIECEQRQYLEVAFSNMVTNLLHEQIDTLARKANVEARERDILFREQRVAQLEIFLAEGQRQLVYSLDERHMNAIQLDHMRRGMDLEMRKHLADHEAKLKVKGEELRLLAEAQVKREEQYRTLIREEIKQSLLSAKEADNMAEDAYKRGFKDGKETGKQEFLKGYHACHRAQAALSMLRKGEMARGDPELDFMFDPAHPDNMFNMGLQIGRLELHGATEFKVSDVKARMPALKGETNHGSEVMEAGDDTIDEAAKDAVDQSSVGEGYNAAPAFAGRCRIQSRSQPSYSRPTLAAELRGPSSTYNGQIVLANNDALRNLTPETTGDSAVQNYHEGPNLIDLL